MNTLTVFDGFDSFLDTSYINDDYKEIKNPIDIKSHFLRNGSFDIDDPRQRLHPDINIGINIFSEYPWTIVRHEREAKYNYHCLCTIMKHPKQFKYIWSDHQLKGIYLPNFFLSRVVYIKDDIDFSYLRCMYDHGKS